MLQVAFIRENKAAVVAAMAKRNLKAEVLIDEVLTLDEERRGLQVQLDNALAESNKLSKEIGQLYKSGSTDKANEMKARTLELKEITKELTEQLNKNSTIEFQKRYSESAKMSMMIKNLINHHLYPTKVI